MDEAPSEWRVPGKRPRVTPTEYEHVIIKYKNDILRNNCVVPSTHKVWHTISAELNEKVKPTTVHSMTVSNRHGLLDTLLGRKKENDSLNTISHTSIDFDDTGSSSLNESNVKLMFTVTFGRTEFADMITETTSVIKGRKKNRVRKYTVLKPNMWTEVMAQKIYNEAKLDHGFNFKSHYIFRDATGGNCKGNTHSRFI